MKFRVDPLSIVILYILIIMAGYSYITGSYTKAILCITVLFLYLVCFFRDKKNKDIINKKYYQLLCITTVYILLNALILNPKKGFLYCIIWITGIKIIKIRKNEYFVERLLNIFQFISVVFCLVSFFEYFNQHIYYDFLSRLGIEIGSTVLSNVLAYHVSIGLAGETSYNAFCMIIGLAITIAKIMSNPAKRVVNTIISVTLFYGIYFTGKRAFILGIPVVLYFVFRTNAGPRINKKRMVLDFFIVLILVIFSSRILSLLGNSTSGISTSGININGRELFWGMSISMFTEHPIFGQGANMYDYNFCKYIGKEAAYMQYFAGGHNSYLQILGEFGLVGGILIFSFLIYTVVLCIRKIKNTYKLFDSAEKIRVISATIIVGFCLVYSITGNPLYQPQELLMLFIFISVLDPLNSIKLRSRGLTYE